MVTALGGSVAVNMLVAELKHPLSWVHSDDRDAASVHKWGCHPLKVDKVATSATRDAVGRAQKKGSAAT